jgi:uncharacterized protein YndB with AHSA1/START domain
MSATAVMQPKTGYELKITRVFDAPRELVWKAWTDPEMAMEWMGPRGFLATEFETSVEIGGRWHMKMVGRVPATNDPVTLVQGGVIKEIRPPELLVYTFAWQPRASVGLPESPYKENVVTVRLEAQGEKTVMHFTQAPFATESERDGHTGGWNSAFDRFAEFMLAEQPDRVADPEEVPAELHLKRFLAAPRELVFDAWTKPEMVEEWWGPHGFTTTVEELEAQRGGAIRFVMEGHGIKHTMSGRFLEFYPQRSFHFTAAVPDANGEVLFENWTSVYLEDAEGGTVVYVDVHITRSRPEAAIYLKGMSTGWSQHLDKLAAFVTRSVA